MGLYKVDKTILKSSERVLMFAELSSYAFTSNVYENVLEVVQLPVVTKDCCYYLLIPFDLDF